MKYLEMREEEHKIIQSIIKNGGEISTEFKEIDKSIKDKIDAFAFVLKNRFKEEELYWKDKAEEIRKIRKSLIKGKESFEKFLSFLCEKEEEENGNKELLGNQWKILPYFKYNTIMDINKIDDNDFNYIIEVDYKTFKQIKKKFLNISYKKVIKPLTEIKDNKKVKHLIPSVKILKK